MEKKHTLVDNAAEKRYELDLGDDIALIEYVLGRGLIVLTPRSTKGRASARSWYRAYWKTSKRKGSRSFRNARSSQPTSAAIPNGWNWC